MKQRTTRSVILLVLAMIMSLGSFAAPTPNETTPVTSTPSESANNAEMQRLINRLDEIKAMDLKNMPRSEKRKYAKEVKQIQKKMNVLSGGVYISAGAVLVILILLLILL